MTWVVAYDICCPRRLNRVARLLEKYAVRCQKSVFIFEGSRAAVEALLDEAAALMKLKDDRIQAWQIASTATPDGLGRGAVVPVRPASVIGVSGKDAMAVV